VEFDMDRRDFLKMFTAFLGGLYVRPEAAMATNGQLIQKLARGDTLVESEISQLVRAVDGYDTFANIVRDNTLPGSPTLQIPQILNLIYSSVLSEDVAEIDVPIQGEYSHLLIFGAGRTNGVGTNSDYLSYRFNNDDGANYISQKFFAVATVLTGERNTGQTRGVIGVLAQGGRPAGDVASFYAVITHCNSPELNKNVMGYATPPYGSAYLLASNWDGLDPIKSILFTPGADSIAKGSLLSVYGIR
jgi:hypothetical protein